MAVIQQGQIWWGELPNDKGRPYLVLTRQRAIERLAAVMVAPVTTRIRGLVSEVELGDADGMRRACVASLDNVKTIEKANLTRRVGYLAPGRWPEVYAALSAAIDC